MTPDTTPALILASSSPYRRDLLARLGLPFASRAPSIDETPLGDEDIPQLCQRLALAKARTLAPEFPAHLIIGCDQSAAVDGRQLHKPGDFATARRQLNLISGRTVTFYTAVAVIDSGRAIHASALDATEVEVRQLSAREIDRYLEREKPYDCAGSFKVEGLGVSLFERVSSDDPTALVGLPMIQLCRLLRQLGVTVP